MRVLHVTDTFLPKVGGAEIAIDQLVRAMQGLGVECGVLAQRVKGTRGEIATPYPLRRFRSPQSAKWAGWWIRRHVERMERELGTYDVLIGHHAFPPGYACVDHALRTGRPAIVYPRGGDIYEVSRFRRKPGAWRKLTWALANSAAVVCASAAMEGMVREIVGVSAAEGRLVRIPNGVNVEEFAADASGSRFSDDPRLAGPFVLGLGRAIRRKGFDVLIDAFAAAAPPDWRLVIAGEGRELEALKARAGALGDGGGRIVFTGLVVDADKRWLLQHCRFMAAPSLEESFGNVALEAMACGRPVVASRASGFAEIVNDGANGRLVDVGNVGSLAHALREYTGRDLAAEGRAARATAEAFSWPTIARRYLDLVDRVRSA
jgi:glycosyltransferase involved in cell wall biosynthesis